MAASAKAVRIQFDQIKWKSITYLSGGGGDTPTVAPYLWTVFFTVDGSTVRFAETFFLDGTAVVYPTHGTHGDLGVWSMSPGTIVGVPESLGTWSITLAPIPIDPTAQWFFDLPAVPDLQSVFGCIVLLLKDGGHIPGHAVDAGRDALTQGVQIFLDDQLKDKLGLNQTSVAPGDIAAAQKKIQDSVVNAMKGSMAWWEQAWAISGLDDFIASWVIVGNGGNASSTIDNDSGGPSSPYGIWNLTGSITISDPCPAEAAAVIVDAFFQALDSSRESAGIASPAAQTLKAMRAFRDKGRFKEHPGLLSWWRTARQHTAELVYLASRDAKLRESLATMFETFPSILEADERQLPAEMIEAARRLLSALERQGSAHLRVTASIAANTLAKVKGKTFREALEVLGEDPHSRPLA